MTVLVIILAFILMLLGLVGVVLPLLPGVPLAWAGLLIYGLMTGFEKVSVAAVVVFGLLTLATLALDLLAPMLGASRFRASRWGLVGVFAGFFVGIIFLGIPGIIIGPLAGAFLGELIAKKPPERAFKSALGALVGFLAGALFKITVVLMILGYFIVSLF